MEDSVKQGFTGRRTTRDVDVDRNDSVDTSHDGVGVVVVTTTVGAGAHGDDPSWVGHLVVHHSQGRGHFVGDGTGDDDDIGLSWGGSENDTQSILVVSWGGGVHHLHGTAGQPEGGWPEGGLSGPVLCLVEGCDGIVHDVGQGSFRQDGSVCRQRVRGEASIAYWSYGERSGCVV